ncbi:MAG: DMT family transporter [Burkholderiales bacterium]|nr:DMT family transporter [Burkholderiales bacterium]
MNLAILHALAAAALFGASTPLAKSLVGDLPPLLLAGLLYLGSGLGLTIARLIRDRRWLPSGFTRAEWPWFLGAVFFGGILGPVALMVGLTSTSGATASLLLNLEAVLTAVLAWVVFRENADRRIVLGMAAIVAGGVVLSWSGHADAGAGWTGPLAVAAACLCWAIDNNLTRKVSASDALLIAAVKGLVAGGFNTALAFMLGASLPATNSVLLAMVVGLAGYGISLVSFVMALRGLGTARTGAYFSTAPFIGAAVAIAFFAETPSPNFWIAAGLMALGVWLHLTETHGHEHSHEPLDHTHDHDHDDHHQHAHDFPWDDTKPHVHPHQHAPHKHSHAHFPDIHHRHPH